MVEVLALIPARGGSKTLMRKNIKLLGGIPLIAYSIAAGLRSKLVSRVVVSTDDEEIAEIARKFGAEVPFMRPEVLAQDDTPDLPVFQHALKWLDDNESYKPGIVVQLRPTSPFRSEGLIDNAIRMLLKNNSADSVRSVAPARQNPFKMWRINKKGELVPLLKLRGIKEPYNMPRQKLPETFWQTGHVDIVNVTTINGNYMSGRKIIPLTIGHELTVDIDSEIDWERAEWLLENSVLNIIKPDLK